MKKYLALSLCTLLCVNLLACGTSKKKDQGEELGKTGNKQGDGRGQKPGSEPVSFATYCKDSLKGALLESFMCLYQKQSIEVKQPAGGVGNQIFQQYVATVRKGHIVQVGGDPNNATSLYMAENDKFSPLLPISDKYVITRIEKPSIALYVVATQNFTVPAKVTIFECVNPEKEVIICNAP